MTGLTFGLLWAQVQPVYLHVFNRFRIVSEDAEIMDWISIYWVTVDFLVVIE